MNLLEMYRSFSNPIVVALSSLDPPLCRETASETENY